MADRGTVSGIYGRVKWPGHYTSHVFSWSLDIEQDPYEDTSWEFDGDGNPVIGTGSDGWRTFKSGLLGFSGSFDAYQDEVPADFAPDTVTDIELIIDYQTGVGWTGSAICTGLGTEVSVEDMATVTIDFQGTLAISVL